MIMQVLQTHITREENREIKRIQAIQEIKIRGETK
jgi:hypothetical protein